MIRMTSPARTSTFQERSHLAVRLFRRLLSPSQSRTLVRRCHFPQTAPQASLARRCPRVPLIRRARRVERVERVATRATRRPWIQPRARDLHLRHSVGSVSVLGISSRTPCLSRSTGPAIGRELAGNECRIGPAGFVAGCSALAQHSRSRLSLLPHNCSVDTSPLSRRFCFSLPLHLFSINSTAASHRLCS